MKRLILAVSAILLLTATSSFAGETRGDRGQRDVFLAENTPADGVAPPAAGQPQQEMRRGNGAGKKWNKGNKGKRGKWNKKQGRQGRQGKQGRGGRGMMGRFSDVWKNLDLTEEQRTKLFTLQQKFKRTLFENGENMELAHFEMMSEFRKEKIDNSKLDDIVDKLTNGHRVQLQSRIDFVKEMRSILDEKQLKKLHKLLTKIGGRFILEPPPSPRGF